MRARAFLCLLLGLAVGCSSGPGQGFSLFPSGHPLLEQAKELRWANAHALQIPRELEKEPLPSYTVEPGDVLLVQPLDLDSPVRLLGDQPILPDGTINLGKYGRLMVAGKTLQDIEATINGLVRAQTKDAGFISVRLVTRVSKVYYVVGAVNSPGAFQLSGRETVLDGILAAGGLSDTGSRENIILSRPSRPNCCRTVLPVCWRQIVQLGDTTTNYQLAPGDRIFVPTRTLCETLYHSRRTKTPCNCNSPQTPCTLPAYQPGPCPEDGHAAPAAGPVTEHAPAPSWVPAPEQTAPAPSFPPMPTAPTSTAPSSTGASFAPPTLPAAEAPKLP